MSRSKIHESWVNAKGTTIDEYYVRHLLLTTQADSLADLTEKVNEQLVFPKFDDARQGLQHLLAENQLPFVLADIGVSQAMADGALGQLSTLTYDANRLNQVNHLDVFESVEDLLHQRPDVFEDLCDEVEFGLSLEPTLESDELNWLKDVLSHKALPFLTDQEKVRAFNILIDLTQEDVIEEPNYIFVKTDDGVGYYDENTALPNVWMF